MLTLPAFDEGAGDFILECDASGTGVGAVLLQVTSEGEKVVAYGSKKLTKAQRNYSATKRELLACVEFVAHNTTSSGKSSGFELIILAFSGCITFATQLAFWPEWIETLSGFDFEIQYKRGSANGAADALSRMPAPTADATTQTESDTRTFRITDSAHWSLSFIRAEQEADPATSELTQHVSRGIKPQRRQLRHCAL